MSSFCSSSSPTSRTIVSKLAPPHLLSFLYPVDIAQNPRPRSWRRSCQPPLPQMVSSPAALEVWFFSSVATAGQCHKHNPKLREPCTIYTSKRPVGSTKRLQAQVATFNRQKHTSVHPGKEGKVVEDLGLEPNRTKEELMALVDQYCGESFTDQLPLLELPSLYQPSDGPNLTVSDDIQDEWPPARHAWPADEETKAKLKALVVALKDFSKDPEEIYLLYRELPSPRVPYLESSTRHRLLRHLAVVERKDERSMLRYLSVVDDMKGTAIPLSTEEWNSALSFASRYVARSTDAEVESALRMWREMEHVAGVKGNDVTFNVLFDVACKAGKFVLAEMIYEEMQARGFQFTRYHYVSQIHYHGLRGDGDGARAAYRALVEAGEIVDTVVLNAMISALVTAHEANAAENIYERMKKLCLDTSGSIVRLRPGTALPSKDYKDRRALNKVLMKMAKLAKDNPAKRAEFQRESIIAPDMQTFRILVNYFAVQAGELDKAAKFLAEMKWFGLPVRGALFLPLFKGFALHGAVRYTDWTEDRLEHVWKALMEAIDDKTVDVYMSRWMAVWALRAFAKCSGKSRTIDVWEQIKVKWNPGEEDLQLVMGFLRPLLEGEDMTSLRKNWITGSL